MIVELVLNMIKAVLLTVLGWLPVLNVIAIPEDLLLWFSNICATVAYFLPLTDFLTMFGIWVFVTNFAILWRLLQRVWDALPFT